MMLRVGGSVLNSEYRGAKALLVFFDDVIDSSTFLEDTSDPANYAIGCANGDPTGLGKCNYYKGTGTKYPLNAWHSNRMYEISLLPNLENEFNILLPCSNTPNKFPHSVILAFATYDYTAIGVPNYYKIVSVYRIFGPAMLQPLNFATNVPNLSGLALNTDTTLDATFETNWKEVAGDTFDYSFEIPKI